MLLLRLINLYINYWLKMTSRESTQDEHGFDHSAWFVIILMGNTLVSVEKTGARKIFMAGVMFMWASALVMLNEDMLQLFNLRPYSLVE